MLHITNGDAALGVMRRAGIGGDILPWRDVLHEGPVPAGLPLEALSDVRAQFIAACGWAPLEKVRLNFQERDARLLAFGGDAEVILWFEHDLYDQLQLVQLLDFFAGQARPRTKLSLICIDEYLGTLSPDRMAGLQGSAQPVTTAHLALAKAAWSAFRSPDPQAWQALLDRDTSALPFLAGSVLRHLEQYPSTRNGLNRTQEQILRAVRAGASDRWAIFEATQRTEEPRFMGDSALWLYLDAMIESPSPLLRKVADVMTLTAAGNHVLRAEQDWIALDGIDRWLGGVHLTRNDLWRWDDASRRLVRTESP